MALSVTSAPWHEVDMPALDLRRYLGAGLQEGVGAAGDMAVAQRAAGANYSVDIAAGEALIQGDTVSNQGRYYVLNDATFNLTGFTAANASNPRIDRVTLRVRDAFHGDAGNDVSFQIVTGTATSGATLSNLNGAAAVPNSQLLLANILIPATATTITTANIDTTVRARIVPTVTVPNALLGVRSFTASGTYTPTAGTNRVYIECIGGGGGSGGVVGTTTNYAGGGGGGGGGFAASFLTTGFSGTSYAIGAAGTAGASGANAGGAGGDTTFGTTVIVAKGGSGGAGGALASSVAGGAGGLASGATGDFKTDGASGGSGGGSSQSGTGGAGGSSRHGPGQGGTWAISAAVAGKAGASYGGGAAGPSNGGTQSAQAGAAGGAGVIVIWEFS